MEYRKFARWGKDHAGDVLRYGALASGVLAGGITFANTGDAVAAENAMLVPAIAFTAGEAYNTTRHWTGNAIEKAGKVLAVVAPAAGSYFLGDGLYNPILTLGMTLPWGFAKGAEKIGAGIETGKVTKEYLAQGREVMLRGLGELPDKDLARIAASAKRKSYR